MRSNNLVCLPSPLSSPGPGKAGPGPQAAPDRNGPAPEKSFPPAVARVFRLVVLFIAILGLSSPARASTWDGLARRLAEDGFDRAEMSRLFSSPGVAYDSRPMSRKLKGMYRTMFGRSRVKAVQKGLRKLGFYPSKPDGYYGPQTEGAVRSYQRRRGLSEDGLTSRDLLDRLEAETGQGKKARTGWSSRVNRGALHPMHLAEAKAFYLENRPWFGLAGRTYGLPEHVLLGVISVETRGGRYLGSASAFNTLASMARDKGSVPPDKFFTKSGLLPTQSDWLKGISTEKGEWAYQELKALILHAGRQGADPTAMPGSIYGAVGLGQFMPSNAIKYGRDGDRDGDVDLFCPRDAIPSVAAYLSERGGWDGDMALDKARQAVFSYNHSQRYVNTVLAVADRLKGLTLKSGRPPKGALRVSGAREFLAAIGPGRTIVLGPGDYDMLGTVGVDNPHVRFEGRPGALFPVISSAPGLTVIALDEARTSLELGAGFRLGFENCRDLSLDNLALVNPRDQDSGPGVLTLSGCSGVRAARCLLDGRGGPGLLLNNCDGARFSGLTVRDCGSAPLAINNSSGVKFADAVLLKNSTPLAGIAGGRSVSFQDCFIADNSGQSAPLFLIGPQTGPALLSRSWVMGNQALSLSHGQSGLRVEKCRIKNNQFLSSPKNAGF